MADKSTSRKELAWRQVLHSIRREKNYMLKPDDKMVKARNIFTQKLTFSTEVNYLSTGTADILGFNFKCGLMLLVNVI